ncbi:exonuclease [Gymnopilus junonius]|uniref:Exonuclease n=1 Tax=Gymnopilus junonius TaxID=109634 RepID=A0A9P5NJK0_GYMJU|nr:exonuclease [Gymnopilus junonius]
MAVFLRRASTSAGLGRNGASTLQYLLVLDFEATCWESGTRKNQEIIEFPTLLYDIKEKSVQATFHKYVRPLQDPKLSEFCMELTGISQETVDDAEPFPSVWRSFHSFLERHEVFKDPSAYSFLCCGDWDIRSMLPTQLAYEASVFKDPDALQVQLLRPPLGDRWINIKKVLQKRHQLKHAKGMMGMLSRLGISHEGRHHSGIDDARNIARIVQKMQEDGWKPSPQDFTWMSGSPRT